MSDGHRHISEHRLAAESARDGRRLLLIADDLTGALDTAAQFVGLFGPISVHWRLNAGADSVAFDTGARELSGAEAEATVATRLATQRLDGATLDYAKLDSLLRGHPAREIAAWLRHGGFDRCVIAPAFPAQGRITREGRQYRRQESGFSLVATDLLADLRELGLDPKLCRAGDAAPAGVSLWD